MLPILDYDSDGVGLKVSCNLVDDGSFSFPVEIQQSMGADFRSRQLSVARMVTDLREDADTQLITQYINFWELNSF